MQRVGSDLDLLDRFEVGVDQDAEPADWDEAVAEFLLRVVYKRCSAEPPAVESSINITGE